MAELITPEQVRANQVARFIATRRGLPDADIRALLLNSATPDNPCLDLAGRNVCSIEFINEQLAKQPPGRGGGMPVWVIVAGGALLVAVLYLLRSKRKPS